MSFSTRKRKYGDLIKYSWTRADEIIPTTAKTKELSANILFGKGRACTERLLQHRKTLHISSIQCSRRQSLPRLYFRYDTTRITVLTVFSNLRCALRPPLTRVCRHVPWRAREEHRFLFVGFFSLYAHPACSAEARANIVKSMPNTRVHSSILWNVWCYGVVSDTICGITSGETISYAHLCKSKYAPAHRAHVNIMHFKLDRYDETYA